MAFLDNSGDIILDAVLTDAGRQRMARGEFKIVKFAFSDEEIDYSLFNGNHPSGSAFADLSIMQTPILEAFTNNTSLMKTKLISINRNNILYLPLFRRNNKAGFRTENPATFSSGYFVSADATTDTAINDFAAEPAKGFFPFDLANKGEAAKSNKIRVDQGMDTGGSPSVTEDIPSDLNETAYLVRIDHRLLRLHTGITAGDNAYAPLSNSFVDDDAIASYYVPSTSAAVSDAKDYGSDATNAVDKEMFDGPLGRQLSLMVKSSQAVQSSDALFDELGTTGAGANTPITNQAGTNYKFIDTTVNVVGVTSGYSIDIPIRIWKKFQ
jgi:hypothetical protein